MANNFCRLLSNGYSFTAQKNKLVTRPCCLYMGQDFPVDENLIKLKTQQSLEINDWTHACSQCHQLEQFGQPSLRQSGPDWISDIESTFDPVMLDINLDSACNAACVTCGSHSSSLWSKEISKSLGIKRRFVLDEVAIDQHIADIVNSVKLDKVRYVKFFGGEPLFTDTHLKFLQHLPNPEITTLHYTTNASMYPNQQTLQLWSRFKCVIVAASLDGIEDQFDYVRWPLQWSKVSNNLRKIKNNPDINNIIFRIEFTANFLNTFYFDRLENWVQENLSTNRQGDATQINIHPCRGGIWNTEYMPHAVRQAVLDKYVPGHRLHQLISQLSYVDNLKPWSHFVRQWDPVRKNSWQKAFPKFADLHVLNQ